MIRSRCVFTPIVVWVPKVSPLSESGGWDVLSINVLIREWTSQLKQNDNCLHLLVYCTNKHVNNLQANWHNKARHDPPSRLFAHPTTKCFTLINACNFKNRTPDNTIPSWLLLCSCYPPRCKCLTRLHPITLWILGTITNLLSYPPQTSKYKSSNSLTTTKDSHKQPPQQRKKNATYCNPY